MRGVPLRPIDNNTARVLYLYAVVLTEKPPPGYAESIYRYYSANLLASSTRVYSINFDTRYPFGNGLWIKLRRRIDYREILSDMSSA